MILLLYLLIGLTSLTLAKNAATVSQAEYWPAEDWRTASPEQHNLNKDKLTALVNKIHQENAYKDIHSLLIVKDGYLILEEYFTSYDKDDIHTLQSVTKSIASTLVGCALQHGFIKSLDQPVISFFPEYQSFDNLTEDKKAITLQHALTMQTGMAWFGESHLGALNRYQGDKMKFVLDYKMDRPPGEKWYYNSGIAVLLGGLLKNATGMRTQDFADKYLFAPLGIKASRWSSHRDIPHTGGGLYLKPRDMAKIGYLYLKDGVWQGKRILPEGWVAEATKRHVPIASKRNEYTAGYGYMWWILPFERHNMEKTDRQDIYTAYGYMGQFIFVIPELNMVAVFTGGSTRWPGEIQPFDLLYAFILPAAN